MDKLVIEKKESGYWWLSIDGNPLMVIEQEGKRFRVRPHVDHVPKGRPSVCETFKGAVWSAMTQVRRLIKPTHGPSDHLLTDPRGKNS